MYCYCEFLSNSLILIKITINCIDKYLNYLEPLIKMFAISFCTDISQF